MHELYDQAASSGFITGKGKDRKVHVFGLEGGQEGYINVPAHIHQPLAAGEPVTFLKPQYDSDGDVVKVSEVKRRLVEVEGGWAIETSKGSGKSSKGKMVFPSKEEAIIEAFERDFKARLNRELVREIETRFPKVREFMNFTSTVEKIMRGRGSKTIKVTPPDGIPLEYRFKDSEIYAPFEANLGDKVVKRLGLKTEDGGTKGRGLAAFIAHSHDAFVLREAFRQLNGEGGLSGFNPIHDSFGFHPSDAARGQDKVLEIMQALGNQNYNIFESILKDNNISLEEFQDAASSPMIERQGINPVPSSEIPTAVS